MKATKIFALAAVLLLLTNPTSYAEREKDLFNKLLVPEGEPASPLHNALDYYFSPQRPDHIDKPALVTGESITVFSGWSGHLVTILDDNNTNILEMVNITKPPDNITAVALKHDDSVMATGSTNGTIRLWRLGHDKRHHTIISTLHIDDKRESRITDLAISKDATYLAAGDSAGSINIWNISSIEKPINIAQFQFNRGIISSIISINKDAFIAAQTIDFDLNIWKFSPDGSKISLGSVNVPSHRPYPVSITASGEYLATGDWDGFVRIWRLSTQGGPYLADERRAEIGPVNSIAFSLDEHLLAITSRDGPPQLWSFQEGKIMNISMGPQPNLGGLTNVSDMKFRPDNHSFVMALSDNSIRVGYLHADKKWDLSKKIASQSEGIASTAISPSGSHIAIGYEDGILEVLRVVAGGPYLPEFLLAGHTKRISSLAFSPDGTLLASASWDKTVRIWRFSQDSRAPSGELSFSQTETVDSVAFSPNGEYLATGSSDNNIRLWRILADNRVEPVTTLAGHTSTVTSILFSPNGKLMISGALDNHIILWDSRIPTRTQPILRKLAHSNVINHMSISPDGALLVSASNDRTARIWRIVNDREIRLATILSGHMENVNGASFSKDGRLLFTSSADGLSQIWRLNSLAQAELIERLMFDDEVLTTLPIGESADILTAHTGGRLFFWRDGQRIGQFWRLNDGWLSQMGDRLYRHDLGGVLARQTPDRQIQVIPPPRPAREPQLSLELQTDIEPAFDGGNPGHLSVRVRNATDAGRAYWLRLYATELPDGVTLRTGPVHMRLEPGDSVDIPVDVYVLSGESARANLPKDQEPTPKQIPITLTLSHAFGQGPRIQTMIDWRAPALMGEFKLSGERTFATVEVTVRNAGNLDPKAVAIETAFLDPQGNEVPVEGRQQFDAGSLAPGKSVTFSLPVPDVLRRGLRFYTQPLRVKLRIRDGLWYTHLWQPQSEPLRPVAFVWSLAALVALLALLGVGLRLYLDPVVRATARDAAALRRFPLSALPRVSGALARVRRLDSALDAAGLKRAQWDRALHTADSPRAAAQALADALGATLGAEVEPGCPAYAITLPPLALRFAQHAVACVVTGRELDPGRAATLARQLHQEGRGSSVVLLIDLTERTNAKVALRDAPHLSLVALPADAFRDLLLSDSPTRSLEAALVEQRPVVTLSPYVGGGGVTESSMFFGRAAELRQIADERPHNVLLVGPRQMGKSTLLHALERRIRARGDLDVQHHTLVSDDILSFLGSKLGRPRPQTQAELYDLLAGEKSRPRMWLLDEADGLVRADRELDHMLSRTLRALADDGRAFFVLAGFWQLYAAVALDPNSPLRNFGRTLRLGPLDRDAARELATQPMAALRLTYDAPDTVDYLLDQTGCRANLVAVACSGLIEGLDPTARSLTRGHVEAVLKRDKGVRDALSFWRGSGGLDGQRTDGLPTWARALDRALLRTALLCTAAGPRPSRSDLRARLDAAGLRPSGDAFQQSLDRVELSYLLIPDEYDRYFCPIPLIQSTIEREQPLAEGLAEDVEDYEGAVR